jgi:hypothetical protein
MAKQLRAACAGVVAGFLGLVAFGQSMKDDDPGSSATGWITPAAPGPAPILPLYIQPAGLNCRERPTTSAWIVERIDRGVAVVVNREELGWSQMERYGRQCWVRSSYLGPKPPAQETSPSQRALGFASSGGGGRSRAAEWETRSSANYLNRAAARAAGAAPVYRGEPGYSRRLDRDGDGVGCECSDESDGGGEAVSRALEGRRSRARGQVDCSFWSSAPTAMKMSNAPAGATPQHIGSTPTLGELPIGCTTLYHKQPLRTSNGLSGRRGGGLGPTVLRHHE